MAETEVMLANDPELIAANLTGIRRRLLELLDKPASATTLAGRTGLSRQKVNYHLRKLESAGFVELVEARQRRGVVERIMGRTTDVVLVDPAAFDISGLSRSEVAGVSGVVATATDAIGRAASVATAAATEGHQVLSNSMETTVRVASPSALKAMLEEMAALWARYDSSEGLRVTISNIVLPTTDD